MTAIPEDDARRERIKQFHERHGANPVQINGWIVYADGAQRELNAFGLLAEPPAEPYERCRTIVRYWEERMRRAKAAFDEDKAKLKLMAEEAIRWANANSPPAPPNEQDLAQLEQLRLAVIKCQAELETARKALDPNKPAAVKEREARAAANREHNSDVLSAIEAIKI